MTRTCNSAALLAKIASLPMHFIGHYRIISARSWLKLVALERGLVHVVMTVVNTEVRHFPDDTTFNIEIAILILLPLE
jgi:hypothetical protein